MSHPQYATYGLPRYVLTFLCHMESHKDCLKWNIVEGSHKLTLTLTWNFRKNKIKETLWEKLQRTIKLGRASRTDVREDSGPLAVPRTVSRFIKRSAQELPEIRPYKTAAAAADDDDGHSGVTTWGAQRAKDKQSHHHHHHHHHWSKLSSQSLPGKLASSGGGGGGQANAKISVGGRQNFISSYSSYHNLPSRMSRGMPDDASPFHGSWPGVSFDASSEAVEHSTPTATTPDMTSRSVQPSPSSSTNRQSSSGGGGCYRDNSAACSKAGDDDDYLADDLTEKSSDGPSGGGGGGGGGQGPGNAGGAANFLAGGGGGGVPGTRKHHSRMIVGDGWSNRAAEADFWPRLHLELFDETLVASGYGTDDACIEMGADGGGGGGGADAGGNGSDGRLVNETVLKCLDSCDKILFRHSTTIT